MTEEFLQYIWKYQLYNSKQLSLSSGEKVEVIHAGTQNFDSGPDFFNSQIRIEKTIWAGNTEVHIKSSDWYKHKHDKDSTYSKIILHVVWENDKAVFDENGIPFYTLELKGLISKSLIERYNSLRTNPNWVPCSSEISQIEKSIIVQSIERKLIERLESKSQKIDQLLQLNTSSWEAVLYQYLARYFGFKLNSIPFELLSTSISYSIFQKVRHNSFQLAALLFGQAGFLDQEYEGSYPLSLKKEYNFLKSKFRLTSLDMSLWKFMRTRPANFPTIRIAQFIALYESHNNLFQKIIEAYSLDELRKLFMVNAYSYWDNHYQFDRESTKKSIKKLGKSSINILLINVIIPILFNYGKKIGNIDIQERALLFLEALPPENNSIIRKWNSFSITAESAFDSQALIQLKTMHCDTKNCLNCTIGNTVLKKQ